MLKGMQFRIYPDKEQQNLICKTFGCCRVAYNKELARCNVIYKSKGKSVSYADSCKVLTFLKKEGDYIWLSEVDSSALQQSLKDLHNACKNFFEHRAKFPKFKKKSNSWKSYRTQCINNNIAVAGKYIKLPKLGYVKAKISMPVNGKINNATIEKTPSGKYFCGLNVEIPDIVLPNDGCMVGIDVGIKEFYSDSNNNTISNPKTFAKSEHKLIKEQRKLSRRIESHIVDYKVIGNKRFPIYDKPLSECSNIQKQRIKIAKFHERIAN